MRNSYNVIISRYITEKSEVLQNLRTSESNRCTKRCEKPKYVFLVHPSANKCEIKKSLEEIYSEKKIKVKQVNIINTHRKKRRMRGKVGYRPSLKKAIVTLEKGDLIDDAV